MTLFATRRAGVLLHPTSLPGGHGIGDIGPAARRYVNWCARAGLTAWQMLPVGPVGDGNSPYSPRSAFASEPLLISLQDLVDDDLLPRSALRNAPDNRDRVRYADVRKFKLDRLHAAHERFLAAERHRGPEFLSYVEREEPWLEEWCRFDGDQDFAAFCQFTFDRQWKELRQLANASGVALIGDVPIFVVADSADVAANPALFRLDEHGAPTVVTGVPPDDFSETGQRWGHPHYNWAAHRQEGWAWWKRRFARAFELFDGVRVDHFIGFHHLYEIPADCPTAEHGQWCLTPGDELLGAVADALGAMPLIAEDLGAVTPEVTALRERFGLPGMRLLHFAFGQDDSSFLPHHHPADCVVYPGTHDNDTTLGWWRSLDAESRRRVRAYGGGDPPAEVMSRLALGSPARTAIVPMQDWLGLGRRARMNHPGTARGNWAWRMEGPAPVRLADNIRRLVAVTGRYPRCP